MPETGGEGRGKTRDKRKRKVCDLLTAGQDAGSAGFESSGGRQEFINKSTRFKQGDETLLTFSIITLEPNEIVKPVHDRMPAILKREHEKLWLEHAFEKLLLPYPAEEMKAYQVSTIINSPANDNPDVIKPIKTKTLFDY